MYLLVLEIRNPTSTNETTVFIKASKKQDFSTVRIVNTMRDEGLKKILSSCLSEDDDYSHCTGFGRSDGKGSYVQGYLHSSSSQNYKQIIKEHADEVYRLVKK